MSGELSFLQSWYEAQCNEDWEHEFGIRIVTLDNPGWHLEVDLVGTDLESCALEKPTAEPGGDRWILSWSDGEVFHSVCDPLSLGTAVGEFRKFVEDRRGQVP